MFLTFFLNGSGGGVEAGFGFRNSIFFENQSYKK